MAVLARRATAEDAPALARMRWRWRVEESADPGDPLVDRASFVDFFTAWVIDHLATHVPFVVEVDGRIAGMAWLMVADRVPSPGTMYRRQADVQSVYVVPELRGGGVGSVLLGAVLAEARLREVEFVTVHSSVRAVPVYRRAGFTPEHTWLEARPPAGA